ncbi:hypothetical protein [Pseudonocardia alni]|jgi:hypothetical protein|uniref:hypothetical protein n=1 Tax=Pseudonocardia alni TaxID=33907 RepID=UPI00247A8A6A|nr:hypothetical protein [Pseudonocardia alni]WFG47328.1 hypothetical protein PaSha_28150 [Pseudonocardia alni]
MSVPHLISESFAHAFLLPLQDPPPKPPRIPEVNAVAPPGNEMFTRVVGFFIWIAGVCVLGLFFGGIIASTAGRLYDHHGSGRRGAQMIVSSLVLAVLLGLGYTLITSFAAGAS